MIERKRDKEISLPTENPYLDYPDRPVLLGNYEDVVASGTVRWTRAGRAKVNLPTGETISIASDHQLDRIEPTINALLGNLTPGSKYEAVFNTERERYEEALIESGGDVKKMRYGTLVYYPERQDLVWFAPRPLKELAWLARNELQFQDPEQKVSWEQQREIFGQQVIGVVGGSVGMNIVKRTRDVFLPQWMKTADPDVFDDSNRNRVTINYSELGKNKAQVVAQQLHATDPWLPVSIYSEGIFPGNARDFFTGKEGISEPKLTMAVEVCDDPDRKIEVGELCRQNGIPLWRLTDFGNAIQVDYYPYDKFPDFPLAIGVSDAQLQESRRAWKDNPANRDNFFNFAFSLVGNHWRQNPEFAGYINRMNNTPFTQGIPQTSIASEGGASHTALHMASVILGWKQPNRLYLDSRAGIQIAEYQERHFGSWIVIRHTHDITKGTMTREVIMADSGYTTEISGTDIDGRSYKNIYYDEELERRKREIVLETVDNIYTRLTSNQELTLQK